MFMAATYRPLSIVDRQEFRDIFTELPVKLKSRRVQMLNKKHDDWEVNT